MKPKHSYGLLTVRLPYTPDAPTTEADVMEELKSALGIKAPELDEELGILNRALVGSVLDERKPGEAFYVVGVESKALGRLLESGNPAVVGCYHNLGYHQDNKPRHLKPPFLPKYKKPKGPGF